MNFRLGFKVHVAGDGAGWAIDEEAANLRLTLGRLGISQTEKRWSPLSAIHYCDRYVALKNLTWGEKFLKRQVSLDYFHGMPANSKTFASLLRRLKRVGHMVARVRVSTLEMKDLLETEGFDGRVQRIPIGIDLSRFSGVSSESRRTVRRRLGIPQDAVVLGSFQKDGNGWGEGLSPKLVKGPDLLVQACEVMSLFIPNLMVLLVGPSRGYVERRLSDTGIAFLRMPFVSSYELPSLYHALDLYMITSREEGGPKAFLEAMASGIPVVSTPVGQVKDFGHEPEVALTTSFDPDEIAEKALRTLASPSILTLAKKRRELASSHSLESQEVLWKEFFLSLKEH